MIKLKKIHPLDITFILKLVNDPTIKKYSRDRDFKQILQDIKSRRYIIMNDNERIGAIRIYAKEISIAILSKHQHKGFAYKAINQLPNGKYWASIDRDNLNSIKLFEKLGFEYGGNIETLQYYCGAINHNKQQGYME